MTEKYEYPSLKKKRGDYQSKKGKLILTFYYQFQTVDNIHKAIDNIVYLEKYLNKKEESDDEESDDEESIDTEELKFRALIRQLRA